MKHKIKITNGEIKYKVSVHNACDKGSLLKKKIQILRLQAVERAIYLELLTFTVNTSFELIS